MSRHVIVVGAGSAGSVVARRLLDAGVRVTVLEAGNDDDNPAIHDMSRMAELWHSPDDWDYFTVPQRHANSRRLHWPRGKVFGGSHSLNAAIWVRGAHGDYDRWEREGATGWSWADVEPVFRRIERTAPELGSDTRGRDGLLDVTLEYPRNPIFTSLHEAAVQAGVPANPDYNGESVEGVGWEQLTVRDGRRLSTYRAYLHPVRNHENLDIRSGFWVTRVLVEDGRAVGVEGATASGSQQIRADEVLLCSGALDTPRVLLLSGIGPREQLEEAGIEVVRDLPGVGKNLHDHLLVPVIVTTTTREIPSPAPGVPVTQMHHFTTFREGSDVPDTQPIYFSVPVLNDGQEAPASSFTLYAGLITPTSRGSLRLANGDPTALVHLDPSVLATDEDVASLVASVKECRRIAQQPAVRDEWGTVEVHPGPEVVTDEQIAEYVRAQCVTYHHQVGTCRMGTDDLAVVDPRTLGVHGVPGLRVVDASVMPSVPSGNTNAPSVMIGERGAEFLLQG